MTSTTTAPTRAQLIDALRAFIEQRPGMHPADYGDWQGYRAESRAVTADLHDARALLAAVERRSGISADDILRGLDRRLTWNAERAELDYCTGQYFATEYRPAVARACIDTLWRYWYAEHPDSIDAIRAEVRRTFRTRRLRRYFQA